MAGAAERALRDLTGTEDDAAMAYLAQASAELTDRQLADLATILAGSGAALAPMGVGLARSSRWALRPPDWMCG